MMRRRPSRMARAQGCLRRAAAVTGFAIWSATTVGCEKPEPEPPDRSERVRQAEVAYSVEAFDTIAWASGDARATVGNEVYAAKCRNCHGTVGRAGTEYALSRGLSVPSLVEPDWPLADSLNAVRRRVFSGHEAGMPTWGVAGITNREIDAVAYYVTARLRPEILGGG